MAVRRFGPSAAERSVEGERLRSEANDRSELEKDAMDLRPSHCASVV